MYNIGSGWQLTNSIPPIVIIEVLCLPNVVLNVQAKRKNSKDAHNPATIRTRAAQIYGELLSSAQPGEDWMVSYTDDSHEEV